MKQILVVEDDRDIADLLAHHLGRAGYATDIIADGGLVMKRVRQRTPDLIVLDLMLPGLTGLEICRQLRAEADVRNTPVIMLTARADETDRIVGLEIGADDYVTKPFSPKELVARVGAVLRRSSRSEQKTRSLVFGLVVLDVESHQVTFDGREVRLTAKEFLLLKYLIEHQGRVLSRDVLLSDVWGYTYTGGTRTVDVHVRHLRSKVPVLSRALVTVKQFGYKLVEQESV